MLYRGPVGFPVPRGILFYSGAPPPIRRGILYYCGPLRSSRRRRVSCYTCDMYLCGTSGSYGFGVSRIAAYDMKISTRGGDSTYVET